MTYISVILKIICSILNLVAILLLVLHFNSIVGLSYSQAANVKLGLVLYSEASTGSISTFNTRLILLMAGLICYLTTIVLKMRSDSSNTTP